MSEVEFSWGKIKHRRISANYAPLIEKVRQFFKLIETDATLDCESTYQLHNAIIDEAKGLLDPEALTGESRVYFEAIIAKSLGLLVHQNPLTMDAAQTFDSFGSKCLHQHKTDIKIEQDGLRSLEERIVHSTSLSQNDIARIAQENKYFLQDAELRKTIVSAICQLYELDQDRQERAKVLELFQDVYGQIPVPADQVKLIATSNLLFFCLPFDEKTWRPNFESFASLKEEDQRLIRNFFERINSFKQGQFSHFPVFGFIKGSMMNPAFVDKISALAGIKREIIEQELSSLVTVLPMKSVDKYLLHDVWGHGWQASMLDFEKMYQKIASYADPFEEYQTELGLSLLGCFENGFDSERFRDFLQTMMIEKLPAAMTPVLAEMLADVMEYKFIEQHPDLADQMPSSSAFKDWPVKLDLLATDLRFYFHQCSKSIRLWLKNPNRQLATKSYLESQGVKQIPIESMLAIAAELCEQEFDRSLQALPINSDLEINLFTRMVLNYLAIHSAIIRTYEESRRVEATIDSDLADGLIDLMIVSAGVYFEVNPQENMWHLDEYLSYFFIPLSKQILASQ